MIFPSPGNMTLVQSQENKGQTERQVENYTPHNVEMTFIHTSDGSESRLCFY